MKSLQIGDVARLLGVTPKTIRHYQKLGLISEPARADNGYRLYSAADLLTLQRIRQLQGLGFSLRQIFTITHSADMDTLIHSKLLRLRRDIEGQQEKLQRRHEQIEAFLAKGSTLGDIEQPSMPSPTYQSLQQGLKNAHDLPDTLLEFDRKLFARLDAFQWGKDYDTYWQAMADKFAQPSMYDALQSIASALIQVANVPSDDKCIEQLAQDIIASGAAQLFAELTRSLIPPDEPFPEIFSQLTEQTAEVQLSASQMRFIQRLGELADST